MLAIKLFRNVINLLSTFNRIGWIDLQEHDELHCDVIGSKTAVPGQVCFEIVVTTGVLKC